MRPGSPFKPSASTSRVPNTQENAFNTSPGKGKGRAIFVDVLVEGVEEETSYEVPAAARTFLAGLGEVLQSSAHSPAAGPSTPSRKETNPVALKNTLTELLTTERSYVKRIRHLYSAYTVPLKTSAKTTGRNPMGITAYEANSLFSNIEKIVALNDAFLRDLEPAVKRDDTSWAQVVLQHLSLFEPYNVYVSNYPTAKEIEKRLASNSTFVRFCENVQYSPAADVGNAGLRDLLAEPFQRIARYPLMLSEMLRQLSPNDPLRPLLTTASATAVNIAHNEHDEVARRTEEMLALSSTIADFPKTLINGHRRFIDSIDVKDVPSGSTNALHATLFLFSDMLVIAKRPSSDKGKALAGLERSNTMLSGLSPLKSSILSSGLQFRGAVRLVDIGAVDDGASFALHFEVPPQEVGTRWSGRPTRRYFAETFDKRNFLAAFWRTQAQLHAHPGVSTVLATSYASLAKSASLPVDRDDAHVFFTIYNRAAYLDEPDKGHTVLRLDSLGAQYEPLGFPVDKLKPQIIVDADHTSSNSWRVRLRKRGETPQEGARSLGHSALAYSLAQTVLQAGLAEVPPRYSQHVQAEPFSPMSPGKHRRTQSNASKGSSATNSLRESAASAAFGSNPSIRSDSFASQDDAFCQPAVPKRSRSDESIMSGASSPGRQRTQSSPARPDEDVFGPTLPLSPRSRTPLGPRPSPPQRRKPVPYDVEEDVTMQEEEKALAAAATLKRQREETEAPASPSSTHERKRSTPPQRARTTGDYSPGVRSPLGRHPPRRAVSDREPGPGGLIRDIDEAIQDAAGRSDSMMDLKQKVNTFVMPEGQSATPSAARSGVSRSGATVVRAGSIPRSPKLGQLAFEGESSRQSAAQLEAFKAEVNDKLDALLGGWEDTTKQYRRLAETYKTEKLSFSTTLASRDARIKELEEEGKALKTSHSQLNEEVQEIYNAVNKELDRIFEEAKLPADEATRSLQRELKRKTADEVLLKYRIQQLEAKLAAKESS